MGGTRNRKPGSQKNGGDGDSADSKTSSRTSSNDVGGMTFFNWFFIIFLIVAAAGGTGFFLHQEMQLTNRALTKEFQKMRADASAVSEFRDKIEIMVEKLNVVKQLQDDVTALKEQYISKENKIKELEKSFEVSQQSTTKLHAEVSSSIVTTNKLAKTVEEIQNTKSETNSNEEAETSLKNFKDSLKVSDTNVAYLSNEVMRLDKKLNDQFDQMSNIQRDVISLTADKTEIFSVLDSIRTTVASIREFAEQLDNTQLEYAKDAVEKIQGLEKTTTERIVKLSTEIQEMKSSSGESLQTTMNSMKDRFEKELNSISRKFQELEVKVKNPTVATDMESIVNTLADFDTRLKALDSLKSLEAKTTELSGNFAEYQKGMKEENKIKDQINKKFGQDISTLIVEVKASKDVEAAVHEKIEQMTGQVTTLSNEMKRITTTIGILETRVDEVREKSDGFGLQIEKLQNPNKKE